MKDLRKCPYCRMLKEQSEYTTAGRVHKICNSCREVSRNRMRVARASLSDERREELREYNRRYWKVMDSDKRRGYYINALLRKEEKEIGKVKEA